MFTGVSHYTIWVTDQDEALDFYVGRLGLETRADIQLDFMRWLTVGVPGQADLEIILAPLQPPVVDPGNADRARDLLSKGILGNVILATPACRATYERLLAAGVEFIQDPVEQPYGLECVARDPFGNQIRIGERPAAPSP
jgi:catechol 2,3-dioxygenase-like lactoylglutathione lyase family enzyme